MVKDSELPDSHPNYKPIHCEKQFNLFNRKLHKLLARTGWYEENVIVKKTNWRRTIPKGWSGCKPSQFPVPGMKFTSVMHVPSSRDGRLLKMLCKAEPRIAKISGYQVKFIEKSGQPLSHHFPKEPGQSKCFREDCPVCINSSPEKPSLCQVKSVVYKGECQLCAEGEPNTYIGETSRTLAERVEEHHASCRRMESKSFMFKHWSDKHRNEEHPPEFKFSVVKTHSEPMSRLIHESLKISQTGNLNSKSEWGGTRFPD